jgi:hypothetical protein
MIITRIGAGARTAAIGGVEIKPPIVKTQADTCSMATDGTRQHGMHLCICTCAWTFSPRFSYLHVGKWLTEVFFFLRNMLTH